jgi:uncharacterized protein involved in exopolysaccharide biosynthesis
VESLRQNTAIQEVESLRELDFPANGPTLEAQAPESEWFDRLHLVWESRRLLYKAFLCALVVGTAIAFLLPKRYESTVSIMPPESLGSNGMMMAALASKTSPELASIASNLLGTKSTSALFDGLLHSRTVADHIVDRFNLQSVYWVRYKWDARKILNRRTDVADDRKSGIITITVSDRDPQRAHGIAQAFVEELNKLVAQVSTSSARRERIFIEQRLSNVKTDLEDAEQQFSTFASKNTVLDVKEQTKAMVESGALLQGQVIAAQSELEGLTQIYTPNNVRVRSAQARVDELKRQLEKIGGSDASLAANATQSNELYPSIRKLPLLGVQWADLYRRVKIQETVYELLNQQYELARIQEAKEIPTVNVVDSAELPEKKSWPPRLLIIALLTVLSLAGAAVAIVGSARWERVDPQDPRKVFAASLWRTASNRGRALLTRLAIQRRRNQHSTIPDHNRP